MQLFTGSQYWGYSGTCVALLFREGKTMLSGQRLAVETSRVPIEGCVHLRVEDLICRTCKVEATNAADSVCHLCKAIGKQAVVADAETGVYSDILYAACCAKRFIFGLGA